MNTKCIIAYELYDLSPKINKKRREPSARASFFLMRSRLTNGAAGDGDLAVFGGQTRFSAGNDNGAAGDDDVALTEPQSVPERDRC